MAGQRNKLTATAVKTRKKPGRIGDGGNLYLNVTSSGSKSWVFRWHPPGKTPEGRQRQAKEIGLGPYPAVSLVRARELAGEYRSMIADGKDPSIERARESGKTFGQAADAYYKAMLPNWSNAKSRHQWNKTLTETCKPIRDVEVAKIETDHVLMILKGIWSVTPETAARVRMRIEAVLGYAKARKWRTGDNPAAWRGNLKDLLPKRPRESKRHFAAMPYAKVPEFFVLLDDTSGMSARALQVLILTASRTSEVLKAQWNEIDFDKALWTIPKERMKSRRPHEVPLVPQAVHVLRHLFADRWNDYLFPGIKQNRPLSNMSLLMLMRRLGEQQYTAHGFRSSFRDFAGDKTAHPREVAEAALAHKVGDTVEQSYRRGTALEKRRELMIEWADFVCPTVGKLRLVNG